jgi:glycosyltransferase involved in cell wall biosynthesis
MKKFIEKENLKCKIFVIPNFCETIADIPVDLEKHKNPIKIVFAGLYGQRKGVYDLLAAFEKANFDIPVQLDLYGNGEVDKTRIIAENSAKKECINVNGWTKHSDYIKMLPNYDFLVLPSYAETFPMSILEAMGLGIPVISTYISGIPEMIENGKNGLLFNAGNIDELTLAIEKLANNKNLIIEFGNNAWKYAKDKFSPEIVLEKLENMYDNIY